MKTVRQVMELSGLTARTLHYYDAIGLLSPTVVTEAGYRLYDDAALARLQAIMLFRELEFPLKDIKTILDDPNFDQKEAMAQQIKLLELRREHLRRLIELARELQQKGNGYMDFQAFDHTEMDRYVQEVKDRWSGTAAYAESVEKLKGKTKEEKEAMGDGLMALFAQLGALKEQGPDSDLAQKKVAEVQRYITAHFYHCTDEMLAGLGQMYVVDERMRQNIDKAGGEGTASFAARAIEAYVAGKL